MQASTCGSSDAIQVQQTLNLGLSASIAVLLTILSCGQRYPQESDGASSCLPIADLGNSHSIADGQTPAPTSVKAGLLRAVWDAPLYGLQQSGYEVMGCAHN